MSKPLADGAYVYQRLNLVAEGKAHGRNAKASNRTWEIRPSGIIGGPRKRSYGGIVNPSRNRKGEDGNPPPSRPARPSSIPTTGGLGIELRKAGRSGCRLPSVVEEGNTAAALHASGCPVLRSLRTRAR